MPEEKGEDITPQKDGGVLKTIIKEGTGQGTPPAGQNVKVHYTGSLLDGTEFDSSRSREPFEFSLGKGSVIKAWDLAVATMKQGEVCKIVCREDYAYGKRGFPPKIPAEATLVFEIEMLGWEGEDLSSKKDKGIVRTPITPGTGFDSPSDASLVDLKLIGEVDGRVFDERTVQFNLGEGADINIPYGVEKALEKFILKETSRIDLKSTYAFGPEGSKTFNIAPNTNVSYTLTLNNFEKAKDVWLLDTAELLEQSKLYKEKGGNYFKQEKYSLALKMYRKIFDYLKNDKDFVDEFKTERTNLLLAGHLNISMCHLKLKNHLAAKNECDEALQLDANNIKALFRRGQALLSMNEPGLAISDFEKVVNLEPENKAAAAQISVCKQKMKEIKSKEKQMYANMFEKFAQKDREWRFGWMEGEKINVEIAPDNPEYEIRRKKEREEKRKMLERQAEILKARREAVEKELAEQKQASQHTPREDQQKTEQESSTAKEEKPLDDEPSYGPSQLDNPISHT